MASRVGSLWRLGVVALGASALAPSCWTYKGDVARACDAEHLSGDRADGPTLMDWLKRGMSTPAGVVLANELSTKGWADRGVQLRGEARKAGIAACPLADAYDALAKVEAFKQDVANLCDARAVLPGGGSALLDLSTLPDDAERLREIREWSLAQLKTTEAQDIVPRMGQVAPKDRGQALRAEAARAGIAPPCALADALDRPLPAVAKPLVSALPTLTITGYESDKAARRYTGAALDAVRLAGAAINACYASGLARDPRLSGKLSIKLSLDASGKVVSSTADGVSLGDKRVVKCIQTDGVSAMSFPKPEKGPVKFSVGLSLAPATSMGAPSVTVLALQGRPKG